MPDDRKLFAVTQWVLRAGIIVTMLLIGMFVLGVAATIFALSTSRVPLDKIAHWTGVTMTADEIGRMALAAYTGAIAALALIQLIRRCWSRATRLWTRSGGLPTRPGRQRPANVPGLVGRGRSSRGAGDFDPLPLRLPGQADINQVQAQRREQHVRKALGDLKTLLREKS